MKKAALIFLLLTGLVQAQIQDYYPPKTHRELAGNPTASTRLDTIIWRNFIITDSLLTLSKRYGVNTSNFSTFAAAVTAATTDSSTLVVSSPLTVSSNTTVPRTVSLVFQRNGRLSPSTGITLTINGPIAYPLGHQCFGTSGTIVLGPGSVSVVRPEMFGARNDSTIDCGTAFKQALNAMPNGSVLELMGDGQTLYGNKGYIINTTVRFPSRKQVWVRGNGATIYSSANDTLFLFNNGSQTSIPTGSITPGASQPRHRVEGIRFKRINGSKGTGTAIALLNTTAMSMRQMEVDGYNNGIVFSNQSNGWCENNDLYDWRFTACDTAILYKVTLSGNNSFATNSLRKITITNFDSSRVIRPGNSQAVGIYSSSGSNLYRNVWDQVVIFPKDSVTCVNIDGKAEDLTGTVNFEYIGSTNTVRMRGFHFGSNSSELRFKLHMNLTGRIYFSTGLIFYSQIPGSFGYSGITTSFDGNHNHGIETVVDSTKFTTIYGIIRNNNRITKSTPGDSARIFFANVNNSGDGKLDLRGRRNAPIEFRSMTDNVYSSATPNTIAGSNLPLQPVRLLDIGGRRTVNDSTTVDVRNTTDLLYGSDGSAADLAAGGIVDQLTTFTGGIAGQQLLVNFADDSSSMANLSGASGSGRLFLVGNRSQRIPKGTKSLFFFETESGGVFAREVFRSIPIDSTTWNPGNLASGAVDSVDVTYIGAMIGDPVVVGFSGITSTTADFDLRGHVVASNTIRFYLRNRNAGTYNPPSGTLRYKIVN